MRTAALVLVLSMVIAAPPAAYAGGTSKSLEAAAELAAKGEFEAAATQYAKLVAKAHKKGDLLLERDAARGLDALLSGASVSVAGDARRLTKTPLTELDRELLVLVLQRLDPKRGGAFVASTSLARELLQSATEHGDTEWAEDAARVLRIQERARLFGRAPVALARYADGLLAVHAGEREDAAAFLTLALDVAVDESWAELASFVATELAVTHVVSGQPDAAAGALERAADLLSDGDTGGTAAAFQALAKRRLADAPAEVLKPLDGIRASSPVRDGLGSIPGTLGDTGFGKAKKTPLGRAFKKLSKNKPLASVLCLPSRFQVTTHFEPKHESAERHSGRTRRVKESGLVLRLRGRSVGVDDVRLENEAANGLGQGIAQVRVPGGVASAMRASYLLARDERWVVAKSGAVTISR